MRGGHDASVERGMFRKSSFTQLDSASVFLIRLPSVQTMCILGCQRTINQNSITSYRALLSHGYTLEIRRPSSVTLSKGSHLALLLPVSHVRILIDTVSRSKESKFHLSEQDACQVCPNQVIGERSL